MVARSPLTVHSLVLEEKLVQLFFHTDSQLLLLLSKANPGRVSSRCSRGGSGSFVSFFVGLKQQLGNEDRLEMARFEAAADVSSKTRKLVG